jgi:YHS domain-containing protein
MKRISSLAILPVVFFFAGCRTNDPAPAATTESPPAAMPSSFDATKKADAAQSRGESAIKPYPFNTCAVQIHRPFKNGKPKHRRVYKGHEVLFCCDPCVNAFDTYPDAYMPRIIEAAAAKER